MESQQKQNDLLNISRNFFYQHLMFQHIFNSYKSVFYLVNNLAVNNNSKEDCLQYDTYYFSNKMELKSVTMLIA